jgi:hypothetical protein
MFKDDPLWPEFVEAMRRARIEEDAKEKVCGLAPATFALLPLRQTTA